MMMKPFRIPMLTAAYVCLVLLQASCVCEDTKDCVQYELNVRAVDAQGNDLTGSGVLEKSEVYLFGEKGFVRMIPAGGSSDYLFGNYKEERLTLVAWGNVKEDTLITAEIKPGTSIEEARLQLRQHAGGSHMPVTDIFYCRKELDNTLTKSVQEETLTLVMERMAAEVSIRTMHLAEKYSYDEQPYTFIVRGTGNEVDFMGKVVGKTAGYRPPSITDEQGNVYAPPFRIFPTEDDEFIEIDIYRGPIKIYTVTEDENGKSLRAPAGKETKIEIEFRYTEVKASVKVLPWGEVEQDTEI